MVSTNSNVMPFIYMYMIRVLSLVLLLFPRYSILLAHYPYLAIADVGVYFIYTTISSCIFNGPLYMPFHSVYRYSRLLARYPYLVVADESSFQ